MEKIVKKGRGVEKQLSDYNKQVKTYFFTGNSIKKGRGVNLR